MIFDPKIDNGVCAIRCISCTCVACTSLIDKNWISGIPPDEQERYKPVTKCTYWPVLGYFENCNIVELSHKSTDSDVFDKIQHVVIDGISDNMALFIESEKYRAINKTDTTTNGFYVVILKSEAYTL